MQPAIASPATAPTPTPLADLAEVAPEKPAIIDSHSDEDKVQQPVLKTPDQNTAAITLPLNASKTEPAPASANGGDGPIAAAYGRLSGINAPSQDSQVLSDTLNVINEHITNLRSPASNSALQTPGADSGSEYSVSLHHRMSYIQGEETDEEEEATHTRPEVEAWTPDDVAEFLFTSGVEKQHCEVFRDQEISGEVLLTMDQSSLFIKALDLGSVGRRLKTWHRIKALQDEVNGEGTLTRPTTQTYGSDIASEDMPRGRARTSTAYSNPSMSAQNRRLSSTITPPSLTPISQDSSHSGHRKRPSAASVRDLNNSRRHSSTDYHLTGPTTPRLTTNGTYPGVDSAHKKQASFDRNWTLGGASSRPMSQIGSKGAAGGADAELQDSAVDLDRGYFSGTEAEGRARNTLRKRDSAAHSRKSSYADEQRLRSATAFNRHSRFGSVDSYRDSSQPTAAQKYYGVQAVPHRRTASTHTAESIRPMPPAKDNTPPTVTRLDTSGSDRSKPPAPPSKDGAWLSSLVHRPIGKTGVSIRAISDNLGFDRSKHGLSGDSKDHSLPSPARTGSSTPSGGPSLDLESPDAAKSPGASTPASRNKGRKGKKETSAYTRGLLKISPQEAMQGADYSGWMRKKSSNLMTTWKPRFFVLKGRRLAYYYSEDDDSEKGLIDISFHRVLPADHEKLTGLHASITGAVGSQGKPNMLPSGGDSESLDKGDDSIFIFKLVPPRAGLSRGVHFTKPTVHYFAVPNLKQGRLWMAALMKATIDRDDTQPITTTYQQKTISLAKAKQMRHRPPALMNLEEAAEDDPPSSDGKSDPSGLGIFGEADSRQGGVDKGGGQMLDGPNSAPLQST